MGTALSLATVFMLWQEVRRPVHHLTSDSAHSREVGGHLPARRFSTEMLQTFPLTGSGFDSFPQTFPLYRPPELTNFCNHAHIDCLKEMIDPGIPALVGLQCLIVWILPLRRQALSIRQSTGLRLYRVTFVVVSIVATMPRIDLTLRPPGAALLGTVAVAVPIFPWRIDSRDAPDHSRVATRPSGSP